MTVENMVRTGRGDVNTIDPATGMTVPMLAALHGFGDIVLLLCYGATVRDLGRTDAHGNSVLMLAASIGHVDVVAALLNKGMKVDQEDQHGNTVLMHLAAGGQTGILQQLIDAGANPAHRNHAGQTAVDLAVARGHYSVAATLACFAFNALARVATSSDTSNLARTSVAPNAVAAPGIDAGTGATTPASLRLAIEANDLTALKQVLTTLRHLGYDVPRLLAGLGKLDTRNPFFAALEGSLLMAAAHHGHETLFPVLLAAGAQINQAMPDGWTALMFAAGQGHVAAVRSLLASGAIGQVDTDGDTALIFGARNGNTALVMLLLEGGADRNHRNADGNTALIEATWKGDSNTVRALLKANASPDQRNHDGMSALMFAARDGHKAIVRMLLRAGACLDQVDGSATTALIFAAAQGQVDIVDMLLAEGADPYRQDIEGLTALAWAKARGQDTVVHMLARHVKRSSVATLTSTASTTLFAASPDFLEALMKSIRRNDARALNRLLGEMRSTGNDVAVELDQLCFRKNSKDPLLKDRTLTPMMYAAYLGFEDVLSVLIKANASVNEADKNGRSPLLWAVLKGHNACASALLQAGANVDHFEDNGLTAIMTAAMEGHTALVQLLLEAGAGVDDIGDDGRTPLKLAAQYGRIQVLQALIDAGATVDMTVFKGGQTALMWAAAAGYTAIVQALLDAGADPSLKTDIDYKAVDYAKDGNHVKTVALLQKAAKTAKRRKKKSFW